LQRKDKKLIMKMKACFVNSFIGIVDGLSPKCALAFIAEIINVKHLIIDL
jgi:hypothetical protein